jgi:hypothetical protein
VVYHVIPNKKGWHVTETGRESVESLKGQSLVSPQLLTRREKDMVEPKKEGVNVDSLEPEVAFAIKRAMEMRAEAKQLENQADTLKESANEVLLPLLSTLDDMKVVDAELGTVSVVVSTRKGFSQDTAKEVLLGHGVPVDVISAAWESATTSSSSTSVKYTQVKVKS